MIENKPRLSEHAKRVMLWRESFLFLEENHFFEIMKMYLGEIKTPYNKQKLIANLEGFLHKKESWHLAGIVFSRIIVERSLNGRTGTEIM